MVFFHLFGRNADNYVGTDISSVHRTGPPNSSNQITVPLVTGCGRAGTHSVAQYLDSIGVPAVHEGIRPGHVAVSWWYALDNAHGIPTKADTRSKEALNATIIFDPVVHLVRDPLDAITSLTNCLCGTGNITMKPAKGAGAARWDSMSYMYASRHVHFPKDASRLLRAALYWLKWNQLAEEHATARVRLEGLPQGGAALMLAALGVDATHTAAEVLKRGLRVFGVKEGVSQERKDRLSWGDLAAEIGPELTEEIRLQAVKWGYDYYDFSMLSV